MFLAGPNGAGKSTFFNQLDAMFPGRPFVFINADLIAKALAGIPEPDRLAQAFADLAREHMLGQRVNFATETVFSDEKGAKIRYLERAASSFHVVLVYVTLPNWQSSMARVRFRVQEHGGHDVPTDRLQRRYIASRENCRRALYQVETALILDNSLVDDPLRPMAVVRNAKVMWRATDLPLWVEELLPVPPEGAQPSGTDSSGDEDASNAG